jgi:hypothetical protein
MHPVSAHTAPPRRTPGFLLGLASFADEVCATLARLIAYVGALALIAILALGLWRQFDAPDPAEPAGQSGWTIADGAVPAFALRLTDQPDKSATYTVLRHAKGGRKDIIRWGASDERPALAEVEIYRFGSEADSAPDPTSELAVRMAVDGPAALEAAGVIDSKFGPFGLVRQAGATDGVGACLGFLKGIGEPALRISGWTCQGANTAARRATVGCMLNRLSLLSATPSPDLAALFARAELRQAPCDSPSTAGGMADWVTSADNPRLHGAL